MTYTVKLSSIDGFRKTRSFKTLEGARKFAVKYIGGTPTLGSSYAVSDDGVCKVTVKGCTLNELFGITAERDDPWQYKDEIWLDSMNDATRMAYDDDRAEKRDIAEYRALEAQHAANPTQELSDKLNDLALYIGEEWQINVNAANCSFDDTEIPF